MTGGGYKHYIPFVFNKIKRLIVPFVFIAAIWVIPVYAYFWGSNDIVEKFILGTSPSQLWFLLMLFWVFAIFWWISWIADKKPILGALIVGILFCVGILIPNYFCLSTGLQYTLFFYIGFLIRKYDLGNKILYRIPSIIYILINLVLFIVVRFIEGREGLIFQLLVIALNVVLHIISSVGAFILLQKFVNCFLKDNNIIAFFAKHSLVIYLVHQQLLYFSNGWLNGVVPPVVLVLVNFIFTFTISTIFAVIMSKTKITRFLVGSK